MLWNMPALEQVLTTILWKDAWRMSSPAFEYSLNTSGMDWGKKKTTVTNKKVPSKPFRTSSVLEIIRGNCTKQNLDCDCIFGLKSSEYGAERWISCPRSAAVPRPACRMRWLVPDLQHPRSRCDASGCRWGRRHCWRECIWAADYWAQSGKPGGGNTLQINTNWRTGRTKSHFYYF